jgi:hypothetical protein
VVTPPAHAKHEYFYGKVKENMQKRKQFVTYFSIMSWLLGRKSKLSLENKTLIYKCILKPIWTYGIQLWGCVKPSKTKIIQRLQSKVLRTITNAPWYVSNYTLHMIFKFHSSQKK